ncbi:Haloacid dehalogenase domain protein hydrolase [Syntrophobacter sp. SbD1]|nr:Haloacid dehalogenase domain protein hydrolase [Syntrophobacter sp. SbD1]
MKIESFVFDFDGTLAVLRLDFAEMKRRLSTLARSYFAPPPPRPFLPVLEWLDWLDRSIPKTGGRSSGFRREALALISEMELQAAKNGELFPFARPLLKALAQKGAKTAIITRNCEAAVRLVFPDISDYCSAFLSRDHVLSPKPDPAHLIQALDAIGADLRTAIMIGDHPLDIETGKSAGVMTAGVCSGNTGKDEFITAGADWVARDCKELIELLCEEGMI